MIFALEAESDHTDRTPAQVYGLVFGALLAAAGIAGFFYDASFDTGDDLRRSALLGVVDVNGWANALHVVTGAVALAAASDARRARAVALALGLVYLALPVAGFVAGDGAEIAGLLPSDTAGNVAHLMLGAAGIAAWQSPD
jgi:uncharacterized protein DUF4383